MHEQEPHEPDDGREEEEAKQKARLQPRIYVASLADYNAGRLFGVHIDATQTAEEIERDIQEMLRRSPIPGAEEWAIHDYDGFGPLRLSESESLDYVARVAHGIETHGAAFAAWADQVRGDNDALALFADCYFGEWDSLEDYAREMLDDLGELDKLLEQLPQHLRPYVQFDFEDFADHLVLGGDIVVVDNPDGGIWVFDGR
ncbi:MAG: antirestriction protein ArdA [Thermoleophilia bacterium]